MIRKINEREISIKENLKGGKGSINFRQIGRNEDFYNKIKMFSTLTISPGDSIGYHTHINEQEIMLINKGEGLYKDDDKELIVHEGDVTVCYENHYHGIENTSNKNLEIIAMVIEK